MADECRLAALARRSYEVVMGDGIDAWIEEFPAPDFVWDMTGLGLGVYEGREAMRRFYSEWTSSYVDWFIEPHEFEVLSEEVVVNAVRQGGKLRGSDATVVLEFGQLGVWEGGRLKLAANYHSFDEARAAGLAMIAATES
jgi:hypothetical protein